jgi:hypothetical protein
MTSLDINPFNTPVITWLRDPSTKAGKNTCSSYKRTYRYHKVLILTTLWEASNLESIPGAVWTFAHFSDIASDG